MDYRYARKVVNQPSFPQLSQALAQRGHVAEVSPRKDDPVRHLPGALLERLDDDGFLAFDAERVDRVEQIDAKVFGEFSDQREDLVEIRLHLDRQGPVLQGLGKLAVSDVAGGDQDHRLHARCRGVGGHGSGRVARRYARDSAHA